MIRERTKAGIEAARAEGRIGGRKPKLRENQRKDIIENILSDRKTGAPHWPEQYRDRGGGQRRKQRLMPVNPASSLRKLM